MLSLVTTSWLPLKPLVTVPFLSIVLLVSQRTRLSVLTCLPLKLLLKLQLLLYPLLLLYVITALILQLQLRYEIHPLSALLVL
jgi:hypothetical protein